MMLVSRYERRFRIALPRSKSGRDEPALAPQAHEDADADKERDERGTTVGNEGEGHSYDRKDARHHSHVDERICEEHQRQGAGDEP